MVTRPARVRKRAALMPHALQREAPSGEMRHCDVARAAQDAQVRAREVEGAEGGAVETKRPRVLRGRDGGQSAGEGDGERAGRRTEGWMVGGQRVGVEEVESVDGADRVDGDDMGER